MKSVQLTKSIYSNFCPCRTCAKQSSAESAERSEALEPWERGRLGRKKAGATGSSLRIGSAIGGLDTKRAAQTASPFRACAQRALTPRPSDASHPSAWATLPRTFGAHSAGNRHNLALIASACIQVCTALHFRCSQRGLFLAHALPGRKTWGNFRPARACPWG